MRVYVDQLAVYFTFTNSINAQLFIAPGAHTLEVMVEDKQGYISATILHITVSSQSQTTISGIQNIPGWLHCSVLCFRRVPDEMAKFALLVWGRL
jgi:hypothetical protein